MVANNTNMWVSQKMKFCATEVNNQSAISLHVTLNIVIL